MGNTVYFANILLSSDYPMNRMHSPTRKKGDWFHSISVFAHENINDLPVYGRPVDCVVMHFFGRAGSPVLETINTTIKCIKTHIGKKLYTVDAWGDAVGVIGDIRTENGYESGHGNTLTSIDNIKSAAIKKWGNDKIPYSHQRNESYNCVGFSDDILVWAEKNIWNKRIENMHNKYGLYI